MSEIPLITIYQLILTIRHAGARKIVAKVANMESGRSMMKEQSALIYLRNISISYVLCSYHLAFNHLNINQNTADSTITGMTLFTYLIFL
jgi:hypothetical protein